MRVRDASEIARLITSHEGGAVHEDLARLFASTGALLAGHFRLQGGRHSRYFVRVGQLAYRREDGVVIAERLLAAMPRERSFDVVVAAASASRHLGRALADRLGLPLALVEVDHEKKPTEVVNKLAADQRALIVTDVVTTCASLRAVIRAVRKANGRPLHTVALLAMDPAEYQRTLAGEGLDGMSLLRANWTPADPSHCEQCPAELFPAYELS